MKYRKRLIALVWAIWLGGNAFFIALPVHSNTFMPLREGQYKIEGPSSYSNAKIMIRSDLYSPISTATVAFFNIALILVVGAIEKFWRAE